MTRDLNTVSILDVAIAKQKLFLYGNRWKVTLVYNTMENMAGWAIYTP